MVGGLDTLRNRLLSAAGAIVLVAALGHTPARAADLGGDCCADLEERVAELEATTARKGNKKVKVIVYGKMNWAVDWWNDGKERGQYTVNNDMDSSRFGLLGSAKIYGDWSTGYRFEVEGREALSSQLNQFNDNNAQDAFGPLKIRWSSMYINNKTWGEVRWGLTATPKFDITKWGLETISTENPGTSPVNANLNDTMVADFRMNDSFRLRPKGPAALNNANGLSTITWSNIARCFGSSDQFNCSTRRNGVVYWSPEWNGFRASVGAFEDRDWSAALRYEKTWGDTWEVAAGAAYEELRDERIETAGGGLAGFSRDFEEEAGSAAIKHKPTGLFALGVWSTSESNDSNAIGAFNGKEPPLMTAWGVQAGIQRKMPWFSLDKLGETAFWGGFEDVHNGFAQGSSAVSGTTPVLDSASAATKLGAVPASGLISGSAFPGVLDPTQKYQVVGTDVPMWFLALDQGLEAAAMHVYFVYQHFSEPEFNVIDQNLNHTTVLLEGFDLFYMGGRLYF
jgi:predicted porin